MDEDKSHDEKTTGFHILSNQDPKLGSIFSQQLYNIFRLFTQIYMFVKVIIYENENGMETQRLIKQSLINFFAAILGSVFGLMGTYAAIMALIEELSTVCLKKLSNRNNKEEYEKKLKMINYELENMGRQNKYNKVTPMNTTSL